MTKVDLAAHLHAIAAVDEDADWRELLITQRTFVDRRLAALYGVQAPALEGFGEALARARTLFSVVYQPAEDDRAPASLLRLKRRNVLAPQS